LRQHLLLEHKQIYYMAIIINLIFRISWVLTISPGFLGVDAEFVSFGVGAVEILRRNIWNFFRMENEHLNNCDAFRVVHIVPLVGIKQSQVVEKEQNDDDLQRAPKTQKEKRTRSHSISRNRRKPKKLTRNSTRRRSHADVDNTSLRSSPLRFSGRLSIIATNQAQDIQHSSLAENLSELSDQLPKQMSERISEIHEEPVHSYSPRDESSQGSQGPVINGNLQVVSESSRSSSLDKTPGQILSFLQSQTSFPVPDPAKQLEDNIESPMQTRRMPDQVIIKSRSSLKAADINVEVKDHD